MSERMVQIPVKCERPKTADEICRMAAGDNADALRFCETWVAFCHALDDCVDRDKPHSANVVAWPFVQMICELSGNPFYLQHKPMLLAVIVQGANAWVDSESGGFTPAVRDTLKGMWHEVIYHTAFLTGGWERLRMVTSTCREYDFEKG